MKFKFYKQFDTMDCGPTCLRMIADFHGKHYSLNTIRNLCPFDRDGVSFLGLSEGAEKLGFRTVCSKVNIETLLRKAPLPCIVHWEQNHFVILTKVISKTNGESVKRIEIADPARGLMYVSKDDFLKKWSDQNNNGIIMILEPGPLFLQNKDELKNNRVGLRYLISYLGPYKKLIIQLIVGLFVGSIIQTAFPFLTRAIVDIGITENNLNFIYLILMAQLMLFAGRISIEFIRNWILLHISTRINLSILSDFLIKLMRLPLSFFDVKKYGDIMQRIQDHSYIESFLTNTTLTMLFSLINMLVFGVVLCYFSGIIFFLFLIGTLFYAGWVILFIQKRRNLNFRRFDYMAKEQASIVGLISGMQDIKLSNAEKQKRWGWEEIRANLFDVNVKLMSANQYQQTGALILNEGKNILITIIAAKLVLEGEITLGTMLSIQYIIGQLNSPVEQIIQFTQSAQDAKISIERLNEIYMIKDDDWSDGREVSNIPERKSIVINNLTFSYPGKEHDSIPALNDISLKIPEGKTTAIVGMSGSGKTTLLKLILKFYKPSKGTVFVDQTNLENINNKEWRDGCGVVMQEGYIFSDTIANNICLGDEFPNQEKLIEACAISNILDFINSLPLGFKTLIGAEGNGISQGQKQRILIARAVYKNPDFIFFDEATNSLDANNEKEIMHNLELFFRGRTVVVVAHRLSTVQNSDQIIVLGGGQIMEQGNHETLINQKGMYFDLIKNQLALGV